MTRDVRIVGYCDTCHLKGVERPAVTTYVVSLGVDTPGDLLALDLCGHHVGVWAACMTLAIEAGRAYDERERPLTDARPVGSATREAAPRKRPEQPTRSVERRCPECRVMVNVRTFPNHLHGIHGIERPRMPNTCPDCGLSTSDRTAMIKHRTGAHGYSVASAMLAEMKGKS